MIRNQIEAIVNQLPGGPFKFLFGTYAEVNEQMDAVPLKYTEPDGTIVNPDGFIAVICLYAQQSIGSTPMLNGSVSNEYALHMDFRVISKFERMTQDDENVVSSMLLLSNRFCVYLGLYVEAGATIRYFDIPSGTKFQNQPVYKTTDTNLCGVTLSISRLNTRQNDYLLPC